MFKIHVVRRQSVRNLQWNVFCDVVLTRTIPCVFQLVCVWGGERESRFVCFLNKVNRNRELTVNVVQVLLFIVIWSKQCVIHLLQHQSSTHRSITSLCKSLTTVQDFCIFVEQFYTGRRVLSTFPLPLFTTQVSLGSIYHNPPPTLMQTSRLWVSLALNMYSPGLAETGFSGYRVGLRGVGAG